MGRGQIGEDGVDDAWGCVQDEDGDEEDDGVGAEVTVNGEVPVWEGYGSGEGQDVERGDGNLISVSTGICGEVARLTKMTRPAMPVAMVASHKFLSLCIQAWPISRTLRRK